MFYHARFWWRLVWEPIKVIYNNCFHPPGICQMFSLCSISELYVSLSSCGLKLVHKYILSSSLWRSYTKCTHTHTHRPSCRLYSTCRIVCLTCLYFCFQISQGSFHPNHLLFLLVVACACSLNLMPEALPSHFTVSHTYPYLSVLSGCQGKPASPGRVCGELVPLLDKAPGKNIW